MNGILVGKKGPMYPIGKISDQVLDGDVSRLYFGVEPKSYYVNQCFNPSPFVMDWYTILQRSSLAP